MRLKSTLVAVLGLFLSTVVIDAQSPVVTNVTRIGAPNGFFAPATVPLRAAFSVPVRDVGAGGQLSWIAPFSMVTTQAVTRIAEPYNGDIRVRRALDLGGTNQSYAYNASMSMPLNDLTIEFWVKGAGSPPASPSQGLDVNGGGLFSYAKGADTNELLIFGFNDEIAVWVNGNNVGNPPAGHGAFSTPGLFNSQWHHLAVVRAGTQVSVYVDGVLRGQKTTSSASLSNNGVLALGQDQDVSAGTAHFAEDQNFGGEIDEVRVWSYAQSASTIRANRGKIMPLGTSGLAHQWLFDRIVNSDRVEDWVNSNGRQLAIFSAQLADGGQPYSDLWRIDADLTSGAGRVALTINPSPSVVAADGSPLTSGFTSPTLFFGCGANAALDQPANYSVPTGGGTVTITGNNLLAVSSVALESIGVAYMATSPTTVEVYLQPHAAGSFPLTLYSACGPQVVATIEFTGRVLDYPGIYGSLQSTVNAAVDGDTVAIAAGTYTVAAPIQLGTRRITVQGAGPKATTLIATGGEIFRLNPVTSANTLAIVGMTLRGGNSFGDPGKGGAITSLAPYSYNSTATWCVLDCRFVDNAAARGAAIYAEGGQPRIERCTFEDNDFIAQGHGGVVFLVYCLSAQFSECVFVRNGVDAWEALNEVGAIYSYGGNNLVIRFCDFVENVAASTGGLKIEGTTAAFVTHSIFWGNLGNEIAIPNPSGSYTIEYCDIDGGYTGTGASNIKNEDPRFREVPSDLRLRATSPCRNAGSEQQPNCLGLFLPTADFEGEQRRHATKYDIGADEYVRPPYPGTDEDLRLDVDLNGAPAAGTLTEMQQIGVAEGDVIDLRLHSPKGGLVGEIPYLVGQLNVPNQVLTFIGPAVYIDLAATPGPFVLFDGSAVPTPLGSVSFPLPPNGIALTAVVDPWLVGWHVMIQGFVWSPNVGNGMYAATDAVEFQTI